MFYQKALRYKTPGNFFAILLFSLCLLLVHSLHAQQIDILLKGSHVIDPKNKIEAPMDIAIAGGKILQVASNIAGTNAKNVIDEWKNENPYQISKHRMKSMITLIKLNQ